MFVKLCLVYFNVFSVIEMGIILVKIACYFLSGATCVSKNIMSDARNLWNLRKFTRC